MSSPRLMFAAGGPARASVALILGALAVFIPAPAGPTRGSARPHSAASAPAASAACTLLLEQHRLPADVHVDASTRSNTGGVSAA